MSCGTSGGYNHHFRTYTKEKHVQTRSVLTHIDPHYNYPSVLYHFSHPALYCCYGNKAKIKFDYCQFAPVHLSLLFTSIPPTTPICAHVFDCLSDMSPYLTLYFTLKKEECLTKAI